MVAHELVERAVQEGELRAGEVRNELGLRRDLMRDLEVEHRLADGLLGCAPRLVGLDRQHPGERREIELARELIQVVEALLRHHLELGEQDRLARAVEAAIAQRLDVVEVHDVHGLEPARLDGEVHAAPVVVETGDAGGHGGNRAWQAWRPGGGVERRAVGQPVVVDLDAQQRVDGRRGTVGRDQRRTRVPARGETAVLGVRDGGGDERRVSRLAPRQVEVQGDGRGGAGDAEVDR